MTPSPGIIRHSARLFVLFTTIAITTVLSGCDRESAHSADVASITPNIVVDQFGYLPDAEKVAVIRNPRAGFDAVRRYKPGAEYAVIDDSTGQPVFSGTITPWTDGDTDISSGDQAWWFDFSRLQTPGRYHILDQRTKFRSASFNIDKDVYRKVLYHAFRTFYYQRAGFAKRSPYADPAWSDDASHLGPRQDNHSRLWNDPDNAATERDLSGGWYDAGDYNKYTAWHADNIITLLHAYLENPAAWGDDFNLPKSGNGVSDLLDEIRFGLSWQIKMQNPDGGLLSIQSLSHDSPPSAAKGPSVYGPATTHATLSGAASFALAAQVFADVDAAYAAELLERAARSWQWAEKNPKVLFYNNKGTTQGVGAGQQETDDAGRASDWRRAAIYLFAATGEDKYQAYIRTHYWDAPLFAWGGNIDPFREHEASSWLFYGALPNADTDIRRKLRDYYQQAMLRPILYGAVSDRLDPYRAYMHADHYTWGSNSSKAQTGNLFMNLEVFDFERWEDGAPRHAAAGYLHYLHGVNPLGIVYLSNMYSLGVERSVNEFYHSWYSHLSPWDRVGESKYGPAPGFLVGGPNPHYAPDACCPDNCGAGKYNQMCTSESLKPPMMQPAQKSYKDFNASWPLNSWSVTENSNAYQSNYLRLLSKFVAVDD